MEEITHETPPESAAQQTAKKPTWTEALESEHAVRVIYLFFGLIAILMVMTFLQTGYYDI